MKHDTHTPTTEGKLGLNKETLRLLNPSNIDEANGGSVSSLLCTASIAWCGSRNGCASLDTCKWSGITTQPCKPQVLEEA